VLPSHWHVQLSSMDRTSSLGAYPALPSRRGEGGAARCEAAGPEKPEVYALAYSEGFFGRNTTQMVADRSPQ
jgi:hypothetical protein